MPDSKKKNLRLISIETEADCVFEKGSELSSFMQEPIDGFKLQVAESKNPLKKKGSSYLLQSYPFVVGVYDRDENNEPVLDRNIDIKKPLDFLTKIIDNSELWRSQKDVILPFALAARVSVDISPEDAYLFAPQIHIEDPNPREREIMFRRSPLVRGITPHVPGERGFLRAVRQGLARAGLDCHYVDSGIMNVAEGDGQSFFRVESPAKVYFSSRHEVSSVFISDIVSKYPHLIVSGMEGRDLVVMTKSLGPVSDANYLLLNILFMRAIQEYLLDLGEKTILKNAEDNP